MGGEEGRKVIEKLLSPSPSSSPSLSGAAI